MCTAKNRTHPGEWRPFPTNLVVFPGSYTSA